MTVFDTFKERLFAWARTSPNILGIAEALCEPIQEKNEADEYILANLDIELAEDAFLDIIGGLIGVHRPMDQEPAENCIVLVDIGEVDQWDGRRSLMDDTDDVVTGGYLVGLDGLTSISDPGSVVSNAYYKTLIEQRAGTFRKKMTRERLYEYLLSFGSRCIIDDDTDMEVKISQLEYKDLTLFEKDYVLRKGFKPAGINVFFAEAGEIL